MPNADDPLPPVVRRYIGRAVKQLGGAPKRVRLRQRGELRQRPGGRWMPWNGVEVLDVHRMAFSWHARFPMFPFVWLTVEDAYKHGAGSLEGRLWGRIRLFHQTGVDVDVGEAMRYLAELPWVPHAICANPELAWRSLDEESVEVSASVARRQVAVQFEFDGIGDIVRMQAAGRPRTVGRATTEAPWGGAFSDYADWSGIRVPTRGEVYWDLPESRFVYWRGEITHVDLL